MTDAQRFWYNRMMNVTARGFKPLVAGTSKTSNPWKWTSVRDCSTDFIAALNSDNVPFLEYYPSPHAPSPWKGFYRMDRITLGDMYYDLQLEYGMGDEKSIMLTFDGIPVGSKAPTILPVVIATKKA